MNFTFIKLLLNWKIFRCYYMMFFSSPYLMFARRFSLNPLQLIHCVTWRKESLLFLHTFIIKSLSWYRYSMFRWRKIYMYIYKVYILLCILYCILRKSFEIKSFYDLMVLVIWNKEDYTLIMKYLML